jgi:DNA helicase HerA-like ATPase
MISDGKIWVGSAGDKKVYLYPEMANRHGLIAGATGTGKTVTLKVVAESFSEMGVPVFIADIKGDVSGMCLPGAENKHIRRSIDTMGIENFTYTSFPVRFFDVYGKLGHPVRTTISDMGPELLSRLLGLNDTQSGVLRIVFRIADDKGLLLIDLKDLRSMLQYAADNAAEYKIQYGNISAQSVGAIQRALLSLEDEGGKIFFGEPDLDIKDWFDWSEDGRGMMNILECNELFQHPLLYGTFLLWMLTELYELLPEAGDLDKPKIAFFFDEAHLLFNDAPKALLEKVEQVVRLIRSKGVSVWFITQNPMDIPESVLAQIGNRVQHALRAYTPNEQKAIRAAARSFRVNEAFDTETVLQELATGEALVSVLDPKGIPGVVQRANILPPRSSMNAVEPAVIGTVLANSPLRDKYTEAEDRESAYEILTAAAEEEAKAKAEAEKAKEEEKKAQEEEKKRIAEAKAKAAEEKAKAAEEKRKEAERKAKEREKAQKARARKNSALGKAASSAMNTVGREVGRQLIRGLFGTLKK